MEVGGNCCGAEPLHDNSVCCVSGGVKKYTFQIEKANPHHDKCCTSIRPISDGSISFSSGTRSCQRTLVPSVIPQIEGPLCNRKWYNDNQDMCCFSVLHKGAVLDGKTYCCGKQPYDKKSQSCCGNKVMNKKR